MFSSSRASASASQEGIFAKTFVVKPRVPELELLRVEDFGISKDAQKKINIDPQRSCDHLNSAWQGQWSDEKERIDTAYKQSVVLAEMNEVFQAIEKNLTLLGGKGRGVWDQRAVDVICTDGGSLGSAYVEVTCQNGVPFGIYSLDIKELAAEQTAQGLQPILSPGLKEPLSWPPGNLIINGKTIPFVDQTSLGSIIFAINQAGKGIFDVTYFVVRQPTATAEGVFQLLFHSLDPAMPLVFDDDQGGDILKALGFVDSPAATAGSRIEINGVEIQRPSNVIADVIPGVTLQLLQQTPVFKHNFLKISIKSPEEVLQETLDELAQQIRQFHRLVSLYAPAEPQEDGLLKEYYFLRRLDQDMPLFFMMGFGSKDMEGHQKTAKDFGFELFERQVIFNPEGFRKGIISPEACRNFFLKFSSVDSENIGVVSVPSAFSGPVSLRLVKDNGEDKFFLQTPEATEVQGIVQGTTLRGPRGHPLQDLLLFFDDRVRQAMDSGKIITANLEVIAGFSDSFFNSVKTYERDFEQARLGLQEKTQKSQGKISDVQASIEKKRQDLHKKSAVFQRAFVAATMQEKFQQELFKQMFSDR